MPTRREYLAGLNPPLAIPGARGRLSRAAHAALAKARESGMTFSDESAAGPSGPAVSPVAPIEYKPFPPQPVLRDIRNVSGYTPEGALVRSDICFKCSRHVKRCACPRGIQASPIVARWSEESEQYGAPIDATHVA
jgi:hypothetical protein